MNPSTIRPMLLVLAMLAVLFVVATKAKPVVAGPRQPYRTNPPIANLRPIPPLSGPHPRLVGTRNFQQRHGRKRLQRPKHP